MKNDPFTVITRWEEQRFATAEILAMEHDNVPEPRFQNAATHKLKGPYSPLEVKMHCKVHSLLGNVLEIEEDSVNSIILEDQPCNNHERVLVAAYVRTNASNKIDSS
jgi:ATP-dependent RNA helicase TDRD9